MDRHRRALNKIRTELFRLRSPAACWIEGPETVISPLVRVLRDLDSGTLNRTVLYGGLQYQLAVPLSSYSYRMGAQHWEEDRFWLHSDFSVPGWPASYTRFSITVPFRVLSNRFCECLDMLAAESRASWERHHKVSQEPKRE